MANRQPIFILSEDTQRERGKDAQESNFRAAKVIGDAVRSTLGPKGMDKMLVGSIGDVTITNDGAAILDDMDIEHPAAKMIVEVAETQEEEVGDGTTTAVILAAELIKEAQELLDQGIHPTSIASGYSKAAARAQDFLRSLTRDVDFEDEEILKKVATTAMTGKRVEANIGVLAEMAVKAVKQVAEKTDGGYEVDLDDIGVEKQEGESVDDSIMVDGIILSKDRVHPGMPKKIENAKIALLNAAMEIKGTETDSEVRVSDPEQLQKFLDQEEGEFRKMVENIKKAGANVVICQKGIDDMAQHFLAKEGIFAIRRAKKSDMEKLARATDGDIVTDIDDIDPENLGEAGLVEERKISGEDMTFVEKCKNPKSISILVRGGTEHIVDEADRSLEDAMCVVAKTVESGKIVPGGGATEIELAMELSDYADSIGGKEALAVKGFANAVESIVRALAKNAGLDPINTIVELRNRHESDGTTLGLDAYDGEVKDMIEEGVVEPLQIKTQAVSSGSEAAVMILRIDDVIASKGESGGGAGGGPQGMPGGAPGGMPPGAGGMPPGMM